MISMIACIGKNRELGLSGELVFHIKEDMRFFKEKTMGHPILMGARTFESLPGILPGRKHYVLTSHPEKLPPEVAAVADLESFVEEFQNSKTEVFVIGGAHVYSEMLEFADNLYLTEVDAGTEADVYFPDFDKSKYDKIELKKGNQDDLTYTFNQYAKKK